MNQYDRFCIELVHLATIVRDLTEVGKIQARELNRLADLAEQQTDMRNQPNEVNVAASTLTALHRQVSRLVDRVEEMIEAN